ncbi:MAG: DUF1013 domain-containing protein [Rhizobiaceae bacterium]
MADAPLMPKATAVWLVDNTSLSFDQIAEFCKLHPLEVRAIADGESAQGIKGMDPISTGQLTRTELEKAQEDPNHKLKLAEAKVKVSVAKRKGPRYTPVSKRQDRPNAIRWLLRNHPELRDAQVIRLVGTTKTTIEAIRDGTHWNSANLTPLDPVTLGLCTQISLDMEVQKAAKNRPADAPPIQPADTLMPAADTQEASPAGDEDEMDAASVFSKFADQPEQSEQQDEVDQSGQTDEPGKTE